MFKILLFHKVLCFKVNLSGFGNTYLEGWW